MIARCVRIGIAPLALALFGAGIILGAPSAAASTTVEAAAAAFGLTSYSVAEIQAGGDITDQVRGAISSSDGAPMLIHIAEGASTLSETISPPDNVYLVAEAGSRVSATATPLSFNGTSSGAYGGIWDGGGKGNVVSARSAIVRLFNLTLTNGFDGVGAYEGTVLTLSQVTATKNDRNGVQLSSGSSGTISSSSLTSNGQAVSGTTTGKIGHGLGLSAATASVTESTISDNAVCGVSLAEGSTIEISHSSLDSNGRHGLGTTPGTTAKVSNSAVLRNGYNGVLASGSGTQVSLDRVTINGSKGAALSVPSNGSASIKESKFFNSGRHNIAISTGGTLKMLAGNTIAKAKRHGVVVDTKGSLKISGSSNQISKNSKNGLLLIGSGARGSITKRVYFSNNRKLNAQAYRHAKLVTVPCSFSGSGGKKFATGAGGKVRISN